MTNEVQGITIRIDFPEAIETIIPKVSQLIEQLSHQEQGQPQESCYENILTGDDICDIFKIPKTKLYSLTMQTGPGSIPRFKIGKYLRFKKDEFPNKITQIL